MHVRDVLVRARDETAPALVEAFSFALPSFDDSVARVDRIIDNTDDGADLCGPNPSIRTGDEWRERAVEIQRGDTPRPARNEIDATLENVASLTIDLSGAGIDVASPADVTVSSDGPCTVALRGLRPGQLVASGDAENRADDDGVAAVEIESAGTVEMRLRE